MHIILARYCCQYISQGSIQSRLFLTPFVRMISNAATRTAHQTLISSLPSRSRCIVTALPFNQRGAPYSSSSNSPSGAMSTHSPTNVQADELRQPLKAAAFDGAAAAPPPAGVIGEDVSVDTATAAAAGPMSFRGSTESTTRSRNKTIPGLSNNCWGQDQLKQKYPKLSDDIDADVCVVGGGVSGLTTAYLLAKAGKRVVVVESRVIGAGMTGRAVGDMSVWHTGLFSSLERWTNTEQRKQVIGSNAEAINFVENVIKSENISCGFTRVPAYLLPGGAEPVPGDSSDPRSASSSSDKNRQGERLLRQELEASKAAGLEVNMVDLGNRAGGGMAVQLPESASLNPLEYIQGLAAVITGKYGGRIYESTRMRKIDSKNTVYTMDGFKVAAKQAYVLATAAPSTTNIIDSAAHVLALHGKQHVRRRYVIGLKVPKFSGLQPSLYYDTSEPQHTAVLVPAKQTSATGYHDLLLVAGEAHDQGKRPSEYGAPLARLESWARQRWPQAGERLYAWSYQYFQTAEDLGLYGRDPTVTAGKGAYVATGDCGRILTSGTLAGNVIASQLLGWPAGQLYKNMYNPSRKLRGIPGLPAWSPRYFKNTIQSALDMLLPLPRYVKAAGDIENLAAGEGCIINTGPLALRKVAVYKDDRGEVHKFSGLCPHLGCLLQWNPEEKEWNCPCHGSCFDKKGQNIAGPSTIDMTRLK